MLFVLLGIAMLTGYWIGAASVRREGATRTTGLLVATGAFFSLGAVYLIFLVAEAAADPTRTWPAVVAVVAVFSAPALAAMAIAALAHNRWRQR